MNPMLQSDDDSQLANEFANFFFDKVDKIRSDLVNYQMFTPTVLDVLRIHSSRQWIHTKIDSDIKTSYMFSWSNTNIPSEEICRNSIANTDHDS